jgi:hypothetical protein
MYNRLLKGARPGRSAAFALPPLYTQKATIGVTVVSTTYAEVAEEAIARFHRYTGLDVTVIRAREEPSFAAKLNLDTLIAPRPIVFFDADLWMLRPYDFTLLAESDRFCAVHCPGAWNPSTFPHADCQANGWDKSTYINSGLFACDLRRPEIREVFTAARRCLEACHAGTLPHPVDWTDQFFLNWALQRQPGLLHLLPFALNFYKLAVDWGSYPHIPREIIGLHAAGVASDKKLETLHTQASVFGETTCPMHPEAIAHHFNSRVL